MSTVAGLLSLTLDRPAESDADHCGTGNGATYRFPPINDSEREHYDWDRGYAAGLVVVVCMDCGTELVRYSRLRRLTSSPSRLRWRQDDKYRSSIKGETT